MLFDLLIVVSTNLPMSSSLILHIQESNMRLYPRSHILITIRRSCFKSSTKKTFVAFKFSLPRLTTCFRVMLIEDSFPNATLPLFLSSKPMNLFCSPIMCVENPLSMYHSSSLFSISNVIMKSFFFLFSHIVVGFSLFMICAYSFIFLQSYALCPRLLHL